MFSKLFRATLVIAALCVLSALSAPPALATEFIVESAPAVITGEQETPFVFEVTNQMGSFVKAKCSEVRFEGETETTSATELTVTPIFSSCTLGGVAATISPNGCKLKFTAAGTHEAKQSIVGCTSGKKITITQGNCTISIGEQSGLGTGTATNGGGSGSTMNFSFSFFSGTAVTIQTGSECPSPGLTSEDGRISYKVLFKAFKKAGEELRTLLGHLYVSFQTGPQISLTF
jgi:hypothetical protein